MANDFHHRLKPNINQYRSSYSHIPTDHNHFNFNIPSKPSQPQYQYSSSFNNHLSINSPSTPICSDTEENEEEEEYSEDTDFEIETTYPNINNKWYMAFPDNNNKNNNNINNICRSEPYNNNNINKEQQTDIYSNIAKTKIFNPPTGHINKPKHQLYNEGDGQYNTNNTNNMMDSPITFMGYTNNYDSDNEGKLYNNNIQSQIGITLMGNIQTNDNMHNISDININHINNKENITLMGDNDLEGKIIQFEIKNNNYEMDEPNKTGFTLMGYCNKDNISFIKPQ